MKFMLDMGISPKTAIFLRNLGYDAIHLHDRESDRSTDPAVLQMARNEEPILLTHDLDFGELIAASGANAPQRYYFSPSEYESEECRPFSGRNYYRTPRCTGKGCHR